MNSLVSKLALAALLVGLTIPADAAPKGRLASLNPRFKDLDLNLAGYTKTPTASKVTVPKDFLDKTYLYGGMCEAPTDNFLTLGSGSSVVKVRFRVEGDRLLMVADQRDRIPDIGGASEDVLNRYPMAEVGDKVEIDFAHPEINTVSFVMGANGYKAERPGYIYDITNEPGFLSYGEKYILLMGDSDSEIPARLTVAIKYFLKEATPGSYKPRVYSDEDFDKYGFFTTDRNVRNEDGSVAAKTLIDRRDLSKKLVYILHPSIPQKFRAAFRDSILCWNGVFKKSHNIEPIEVREGADSDTPGDFRKNVLYWVDYPTPFGGGAIGPHNSDPDTGEILDADIVFYADAFREEIVGLRREAAANTPPETSEAAVAALIKEVLKTKAELNKRSNRGFALNLGGQTTLNFSPGCEFPIEEAATLAARAHQDISDLTDDQAMERIIRETIPHEVGHTLGLRHNFASSADLKNLPEGGNSTTVMDYVTSLQGLLAPGPYDVSAIAYGYEGDKSLYEGKDFLFETDGSPAMSPYSNQFDLGDPFEFYQGQYKHFMKLRDNGLFRSVRNYARAQMRNLENLRKFVNRDEKHSKEAFAFILAALTAKSDAPPFSAIERLQAMMVLTSDTPRLLARFNPRAAFESLEDAQQAALAQALVKNVVPDGKDIFEIRLAMVEALKGMNNIYGFKGLEALAAAYKKAMDGAAAGAGAQAPRPLPPREQELALRIQQSVGSYFSK